MADDREILEAISALGSGTVEYHEALAFYFLIMARAQWRRADLIRADEMARARRRR